MFLSNFFDRQNNQKIILCFSIIVTNKCNANCSYCHFFSKKDKGKLNEDISNDIFDLYASFIKEVKRVLPKNIEVHCRFSGGEPLSLGNRVFNLAEKLYKKTGIKPYILTNGKGIENNFITLAKKSFISHLVVSLENPLEPDRGAPNPNEIIKKIKKYNSIKFPIIPGAIIIKNDQFKNLYKICNIFYKKLQCLPTINELGYDFFIPPTKKQLKDLYLGILKVIRFFYYKTPINLFPAISPELCLNGRKSYICELSLENKYKLTQKNISEKIPQILNKLNKKYIDINCKNKNCDWRGGCKQVRRYWKDGFGNISPGKAIKNYCDLKKTINNAVFTAIIK